MLLNNRFVNEKVKQKGRGVMKPLFFIWWARVIPGLAFVLTACSMSSEPPQFNSGGYVADTGVVRFWRLDDAQQQSKILFSVYSPWQGNNTTMTFYEYRQGVLRQIRYRKSGEDAQTVQLRFDEHGVVNFMQRQRAAKREPLSVDEVALHQFEAKHLFELSDILRVDNVQLVQGRWYNGTLSTCSGDTLGFRFEQYSQAWIEQRVKMTDKALGIAWLEGPTGRELLLVAFEDFCNWQPTPASLIEMDL